MTIFQTRSLGMTLGSKEILRDINLDVADKEFVCLLGPSGCGKSTLLELLAGLQQPSSGTVRYRSERVSAPRREIGVVFQDASLFPWRTVLANVELGLEIRGVDRATRARTARETLALVGLGEQTERYPRQLSGGMRQRAGIARALAADPQVLLMDEPFAALDHLTRIRLQQDLLEIRGRTGKTIVFVTHDVREAVFLADRIVLLASEPGRIVQIIPLELPHPRERTHLDMLQLESRIYAALSDAESSHIH